MSLRKMVSAAKRELAVWRAVLRDDRTPRAARWILAGLFAYLASPVDLIPDFIPGLGFLDDLIVLAGGLWLLRRLVPREVVADARNAYPNAQREEIFDDDRTTPR